MVGPTKVHSVRRTLFVDDSDDIASAKSAHTLSGKGAAYRWISPNAVFLILSATLLTIYGNEVLRTGLIYLYERGVAGAAIMAEWLHHIGYYDLAQMLIISAMITVFTMAVTYYDSDVPGQNPPTPFSPRKANGTQYTAHKERTHMLNYLTAIASGLVTFMLLFVSKVNV